VSNPGKLTCGTTECDAGGGSLCCVREAGANQVCGRQVDCLGGDAFELRCDEKADCANANAKCCFASGGTVCDNDCPGPQNGVQVCKTNEECGDAGPCNQKTCGNGGRVLRVCGSPQNCL
jgi:hypothetical protein